MFGRDFLTWSINKKYNQHTHVRVCMLMYTLAVEYCYFTVLEHVCHVAYIRLIPLCRHDATQ